MAHYNCLIIDDETDLAEMTCEYFQMFGVSIAREENAERGRIFLEKNQVDILLLDINLNEESGFDLCREIRKKWENPILFISARQRDDDVLMALNIGGDDYIQKPYSLSVLLAKVKVVLKRYGQSVSAEYSDGRLTVDFGAKQVFVVDSPVRLTSLEFKLLAYLIQNENRVVSKQELFEKVWEDKFTGDGTLNVHIRKIRQAIERAPGRPEYILTVWGDGYRFSGER